MKSVLAAVLLASLSAFADDAAITKSLTAAVERSGIPGAAVVAVDRNGVVYAGDFGLRDVEAKLPVTKETRFYIASSTKSFTALTVMLLAADGKLDVDAPLETVLPDLHLGRTLALRDLLTHRLGFENDAVTFRTAYTGEIDRATLFSLLESKSKTIPRSFSYDNLGYDIAGFAIERAAGEPWKDAIAKRVLEPLGMHDTTLHPPANDVPVAAPYVFDGAWRREAPKTDRTMHAAGGMYATAADLARFVQMSLNHGAGVFPRRVIDETQSPQIHLKRRFARYDRFAYGLGWYLADYDGELLIHHLGGFRGAQAHMSFMPEHGIGVVVLTNTDAPIAHSLANFVYDALLKKAGAQKRLDEDVQRFIDGKRRVAAAIAARLDKKLANVSAEGDAHPIAGTYSGDYGTIVINGNHITLGDMTSELTHAKGSTFVVRFAADEPTLATFKGKTVVWDGQEFTLIK
jgi:CubicO group peptidase (beta-lactamase class C family)